MKGYIAFTKKEFIEAARTYKLLILMLVFLVFGIMSPLTAKFTPDLMDALMPEGMNITLAAPTSLDSWTQFYKNVSQMGLLVLVILFSTLVTSELSKGTLIHMLTKGVPRRTVLLSKFTASSTLWTLAYLTCFAVSYGYTLYFWKDGPGTADLLFSAFCLWLFGILLISGSILAGAASSSSSSCLLLTGGGVAAGFLINLLPKMQKYNPLYLASKNMKLLHGQAECIDFLPSILVTVGMILIFILLSCAIFDRKKL